MPAPIAAGQVVLVTGGSAGIGEAVALRLAARGARLALAARTPAPLERVAAACRALGAEAEPFVADVAEEADCRAFVDGAVRRFGRVDALVANAGISMRARFDEIADVHMAERLMRVNYLGAVYCTHHALPHLLAARGRIAAVSSLTGLTGVPTRTLYAATKHAMRGFYDSLRIELADRGVSVTVAYPGFVATAIGERALGADGRPGAPRGVRDEHAMPVAECARLVVRAMDRRDREVVMTARARVGRWLALVAPGVVDRIAARAIARGR